VNLPPDRDVLHTICQHFYIDDQEPVTRPEGMEGAKLSVDMLLLHGIRNRMRNTVKVISDVPLQVEDVAFSGLCSALAVLTPEQKRGGVILIDMGGGTTDYIAYAGSVVAAAGSVGVGGDHVTNDIAMAFNIPTAQAEKLKRESGAAELEASGRGKRVSVAADVGFAGRTINMDELQTVMNARLDEVLRMVRRRMDEQTILPYTGAGVVLTGGGAHTRGIRQLTEKIFGLPCSIGIPRNISGLATATDGPEYATCVGMVQYGFRTMMAEQKRTPKLGSWLKGLFGR
jgi:cell division protein FtsA